MKKFCYLCFANLLFIVCVNCVLCQSPDVIDTFKHGSINWTMRVLTSKGSAKTGLKHTIITDADKERLYKKAKIAASKNIFTTMGKIQIDSKINLADYVTSRQEILKQIQLMINNAQLVKKDFLKNGIAEMTLQINIDGGLAQLVLPEEIVQIEPIKTLQIPPVASEKSKSTGIIIDARGLKIAPTMSPRIVDENNRQVYGPAFISREYAVQHGTVQYVKTLIKNERIGDNPMIVTGLKTLPDNNSDIVISTADASKLHSSSNNLDLLHQGKVIIVLDFP